MGKNKNNANRIKELHVFESKLIKYTLVEYSDLFNEEVTNNKFVGLDTLFKIINNSIDENKRKDVFTEYTNCVVKSICSINNNQNVIPILKSELDADLAIISNNDELKVIIANEELEDYQVPVMILEEYKKVLKK